MDTFLSLLLGFVAILWEVLSIVLRWVVDHFFEIAVLYALFIFLPRCMALMRADSDDIDDLYDKVDEIIRLLDELNSKAPDPHEAFSRDIDEDLDEDLPPLYESAPAKSTKPYPY